MNLMFILILGFIYYFIMDPKLEIRKLPPKVVRELADILDSTDSWKKLMASIPKNLNSNDFRCDIRPNNHPLYHSEHFRVIEQGAIQYKLSCTAILLDDWGTTGRPRATLGHLKYLLIKTQLFRAADYIANLLNEEPPQRPQNGPGASIPTNLSELENKNIDPRLEEIEKNLDKINYTNIAIANIQRKSNEVKNTSKVIPKIVISDSDNLQDQSFNIPLVISREKSEISDLIKFSSSENESDSSMVPSISVLLKQEVSDHFQEPETYTVRSFSNNEDSFIPAISDMLNSLDQNEANNLENIISNSENSFIPAISDILDVALHSEDESNTSIPQLSKLLEQQPTTCEDHSLIPNLSALNLNIGSLEPKSISKCSSPLPSLSLNTQLPHFTYKELEAATNNFSDIPYLPDKDHGRFLGAGAFGSVFLGIGLLAKPVAVKKIILGNVDTVSEDDLVTRQFRNEVEFLSKYRHDNLVSLLGYSCDGCTYCLVYEYVSGGALSDVLEKNPRTLVWKQRLDVALGTAKAIAYLHTAFSTPLIHRDIKSANILIDESFVPKLCDFGIVKLLPSQKTSTQTALFGTSAYMSPEYHRGDISIKLDTFSFGVVLLELLTSLPALDYKRQGADLVTFVEDNCESSIEPLLDRSVGSWMENEFNFAEELFNLTLKCLDDKKHRPVMVEVREALETIVKRLT